MAYFIGEQCTGCTACSAVCPVKAISGERKQRHSINARRCIECGVCGRICPRGTILDTDGRAAASVPRAQWKKPVFDTPSCSACSICLDICRFKCIDLTRPQYSGDLNVHACLKDPKKCVGCGMCADACPLKVIKMEGGSSDESAKVCEN